MISYEHPTNFAAVVNPFLILLRSAKFPSNEKDIATASALCPASILGAFALQSFDFCVSTPTSAAFTTSSNFLFRFSAERRSSVSSDVPFLP
jgi:hypothetical protein